MKRRWCSILAALALCLCLLPMTAMAELLPNVEVGETLPTVSAGNEVSQNAGTITTNNGRIFKNMETGVVTNNSNMTEASLLDGSISQNSGRVIANSGFVDLNYGEVTQNKGISFKGVTNGVGHNFGTVGTNRGQVGDNHPEGTVVYNEANSIVNWNRGTVRYNNGDISSNSGTVENMQGGTIQSNSGTVETMQGGTILSNTGTVENMTGGTVYNSGGGSVTNSTAGELWWAAEISGGENVTFTNTETVDGRTFLKPGSTLAPAGERDILKVTAENAELTPEGRGYRVTDITAAPVTLTVETLPAVALVRVNGEETYYADIQEAFDAANAAGAATVELLANAALPDGKALTVGAGQMINLNCNEFTLSGSYGNVIYVGKNGTLEFSSGTLKNTGRSGNAVYVSSGSFIMSGGTLEASDADTGAVAAVGDSSRGATVTISGGSVGAGGRGLNIGVYTTVRLSGGTYGSIDAGSGGDYATPAQKAVTVPGLLETGYAFFKDGQPVALEPEQHYLEGPVTVERCTHIYEYVQTEGEETHSKVCPACGDKPAAESCAFGGWTDTGDEAAHKGVCACGREKTEEHSWRYSAEQTGKVSTISRVCGSCGRSETVGTLTISEDLRLTFGQTAGRKVEVTPDPETLELGDITWHIDAVEVLAANGLTCNLSGKKVSTETYKFTASCHGCAIELTADVTVEPAPLPEDKIQVAGGPFTFANMLITPAVTVEGLTEGTDYTVAYKDNFDAGTASIVITGQGNYAGTVTKTFEIEKAALTFSGTLMAGGLTYGTPLSEAVVAADNPPQFNGNNVSGKWEIQSEDTPDVGKHTCTAVFVPSMDTMAKNCEPLTRDVTVTVNRKSFDRRESYVKVRAGKTMEVKLAALNSLPEEMLRDGELTVVVLRVTSDTDGIFDGTPTVTDGKPAFRIKESAAEGQQAGIGFTVQSKNMECPYVCHVLVVDKLTPMLRLPSLEHTYDGQAPDLTAAISQMTAEYNGEPVSGTFTVKNPESVPVHVRESGSVTVVFTPEDTENYDTAEDGMWTEILPAEITVRVASREATQNGAMPEPAYTVEGLAPGEVLKTEPTLTCEARDTATAGTYAITAAGAEVPDGGDYKAEIAYVDGTLTVKAGGGGGGNPPVDPDPPGPDEPDPPGPDEPDPPGPDEPDPPGPDEPDPPDPGETEVKLEIKEGFTEVPPALRELEHLNTPEKLTRVMRTLLTQTGLPEGNTVVYDVALMVSTDGGKTWVPATAGNFPSGGLTVTLPYPEGTGPAYRFTVVHMFTTTDFGKTPGETETFGPDEAANTEEGIQVTLTGLSPVSIGWTEPQDPPKPPDPPAPDDDDDDDDDDDRGSGSGGGSVSPTYRVVVEKADGGSVSASRNWASGGSAVTLTVKTEPGYRLDTLTVTDVQGREVRLTDKGGGQYGFTMPGRGDVKVKAVFAPLEEDAPCDGGEGCPSRSFVDLVSGAWYHEAVDFVLERGLMSGYGDGLFGPDNRLSRAQFAQILYNQAGRPAAGEASFADVAPDAWCAPAVAWAAERGVAGGYGNGTFGPDDPITREQLAVMLWRYAGSPAAPGGELSFMDAEHIGAHAREAICWAVESGVMSGKSGGVLDPKGFATRAQTAQMLRNFLEQE